MTNYNFTKYLPTEFKNEFGIEALIAVLDGCHDCNLDSFVEGEVVLSKSFRPASLTYHASYNADLCFFEVWLEFDDVELGYFADADEAAEAWNEYCAEEYEEYISMRAEERRLNAYLGW